MKIGYGRVSTLDQSLDAQQDALKEAGCDRVFVDKASGKTRNRPEFIRALETVREDDQFIVTTLDRLGRSTLDQLQIAQDLRQRKVRLVILDMGIDFSTIYGEVIFTVMAAIAQAEARLNRERTMLGLAAARKKGRHGGRPPALSRAQQAAAVRFYRENDHSQATVAKEFGVSPATLAKYIREHPEETSDV